MGYWFSHYVFRMFLVIQTPFLKEYWCYNWVCIFRFLILKLSWVLTYLPWGTEGPSEKNQNISVSVKWGWRAYTTSTGSVSWHLFASLKQNYPRYPRQEETYCICKQLGSNWRAQRYNHHNASKQQIHKIFQTLSLESSRLSILTASSQ